MLSGIGHTQIRLLRSQSGIRGVGYCILLLHERRSFDWLSVRVSWQLDALRGWLEERTDEQKHRP